MIDFQAGCLNGVGQGNVTIIREGSRDIIPAGTGVDLADLGYFELRDPLAGISASSWQDALAAAERISNPAQPPTEVISLAQDRQMARANNEWAKADQLREKLEEMGWAVLDNKEGYQLKKNE